MEVTCTQLYPRQLSAVLSVTTPVALVGRISDLSEPERRFTLDIDPEKRNFALTQMAEKLKLFSQNRLTRLN